MFTTTGVPFNNTFYFTETKFHGLSFYSAARQKAECRLRFTPQHANSGRLHSNVLTRIYGPKGTNNIPDHTPHLEYNCQHQTLVTCDNKVF